jgi:hypothetical protein
MKLVVITAVREFEKEIKRILKKAEVLSFSYTEVTGHVSKAEGKIEESWFVSSDHGTDSLLFYVFVKKENVDTIFTESQLVNDRQETKSRIHIAVLNIEQMNHEK